MKRRLRLATGVALAVVLVLSVGVGILAKTPAERAQIKAAIAVSDRYDDALARYLRTSAEVIEAKQLKTPTDFKAIKKTVDTRIANAPSISKRGTTAYGRQHSGNYPSAAERRRLALGPMRDLSKDLQNQAIPDQAFIDAGKTLVKVNPAKILADVLIYSGRPLRDLVVPAFKKARDRFEKQSPPADSDLLRLDLLTYATDVIAQTRDGADKLDQGMPFRFDFGKRPGELSQRLTVLQTSLITDFVSKIDALKTSKNVS